MSSDSSARSAPGVYRVHGVDEEAGYLEVKTGLWVEAQWGCYGAWSYGNLAWNGYGGEMCSEDEFDSQARTCR